MRGGSFLFAFPFFFFTIALFIKYKEAMRGGTPPSGILKSKKNERHFFFSKREGGEEIQIPGIILLLYSYTEEYCSIQ